MHAVKNDENDRPESESAVQIGGVGESVATAFGELDDLDEEMGSLKSKASLQYAVLEVAGIPRKVAKLARQVSAMTDSERRAFDASLTLARDCLGVQAELDIEWKD